MYRRILLLIVCCFCLNVGASYAQTTYDYRYWVMLTDKNDSPFSINEPTAFLSDRAIERRSNQNIPIIEQDLPVNPSYIQNLNTWKEGINVVYTTKWFNAAVIEFSDDSTKQMLQGILDLDFVQDTVLLRKLVKESGKKESSSSISRDKLATDVLEEEEVLELSDAFLDLHNGRDLHNNGYKGDGIVIAVMDTGYPNLPDLPGLQQLFANSQIMGTKDFPHLDGDVYDGEEYHHGTRVLSIMAGDVSGEYLGAAPHATYLLLKTENVDLEQRSEEINWIAAAEYADSAGADILTTSLGYSNFDYPEYNYTQEEMDGNTAWITKGADIAASKGMFVLNSAGNSGNNSWGTITAPADGDSVFTVGGIKLDSTYWTSSSPGPSADGQVKPEVAALGLDVDYIKEDGTFDTGGGTSFAVPIIAGLSACLWQSNPELSAWELRELIIESSSQFENPNDLLGYGIPDFAKAFFLSSGTNLSIDALKETNLQAYLAQDHIHLTSEERGQLSYYLFNQSGQLLQKGTEEIYQNNTQIPLNTQDLKQGVYLLHLKLNGERRVVKFNK